MTSNYTPDPIDRARIDGADGPLLLDFGTDWCGWCRRARRLVDEFAAAHPSLLHVRIEDGPGRRLGRRFRVKHWPTLVLLADGGELARVVRPGAAADLEPLRAGLDRARSHSDS
ncbi:MAG: thioredoxin family protein [Rhodocyclaceae bacterium]|nr:thioredoxin family protein [Rhodocyclaceae bacterium]